MRFRKNRLAAPIEALKANSTANCHGRGSSPRQPAAARKQAKLARFTQPASAARYFPRTAAGTSDVIHGSQAQLEIPRERLKAKSSNSNNASRAPRSRNP